LNQRPEPKNFDFETTPVGHVESFDHTITETDVETFAQLTKDFNPLHLDKEFARSVGFGKPVVYGMLSASFISTMIGMLIPGKGALWMRQTLDFLLPAYVGDKLTIAARILQKSQATRMLVLEIQIKNQSSQLILKGESHVQVLKKKVKSEASMDTEAKIFLVTGASRGIGAATSLRLASEGHTIGVNYKNSETQAYALVSKITDLGGKAMPLKADVSHPDEVEKIVQTLIEKFGRVDGLVHCAAPHPVPVAFEDSKWETFQADLDTHVKGAYLVTKALMPQFLKNSNGTVVFVSSIYADGVPPTQMSSYVTAKSALSALARSLAVELGPKGVRVNVVSPGITMTDMTSLVPEKTKMLAKMNTPLRKLAVPEDIAESIAFLMGPGARHISGENIRVCGGAAML
jgi:3-oxoacyl-[acyl-carrier protein] reductase